MGGAVAVALTTRTSDVHWQRDRHSTRNVAMWFGQPVPVGVVAIEMMYNPNIGEREVRWRVRGDPTTHTMPFEATNDCIAAVIIAMKLTC